MGAQETTSADRPGAVRRYAGRLMVSAPAPQRVPRVLVGWLKDQALDALEPLVDEKNVTLFERYGVHCTWATVGLLFFDRKAELMEYLPEPRPRYANDLIRRPVEGPYLG